jgi:hypothetical protein
VIRASLSSNKLLGAPNSMEVTTGDVLTLAELILARAERMHSVALGERDKKRQRVMLGLADRYYQLHDGLLECQQMGPWRSAPSAPANGP